MQLFFLLLEKFVKRALKICCVDEIIKMLQQLNAEVTDRE